MQKYRVWAVNDEYPEGHLYVPEESPPFVLNMHGDLIQTFPKGGLDFACVWARVGNNDVTVERDTGIKDKKGVAEIYEGDIVKCGTGEPGVVQWLTPAFGVYRKGGWVRHLWPEEEHVLGNIHEHKHLLEAEE